MKKTIIISLCALNLVTCIFNLSTTATIQSDIIKARSNIITTSNMLTNALNAYTSTYIKGLDETINLTDLSVNSLKISTDTPTSTNFFKTLTKSEVDTFLELDENQKRTVKKLITGQKTTKGKADKLITWINKNISLDIDFLKECYDYNYYKKGKNPILTKEFNTAAMTYYEKKGIGIDYAILSTAMFKEAGIKVRMLTKGISEIGWNQYYDESRKKWISFDCMATPSDDGDDTNDFEPFVDFNPSEYYYYQEGKIKFEV